MRLISRLAGLLALLILAGGIASAANRTDPEAMQVPQQGSSTVRCDMGQLIVNAHGDDDDASALNPEKITLLNWNIYKGKRENWATDFKRYKYGHDVVLVQEARLDDDLIAMLDQEQRYWALNEAFRYDDRATGVMTASRVKPVRSCGQRTVEPLIRFPKTALISYYPIAGVDEHLLVANIHGINFTLGVSTYRKQVEKLYDAMKHHDGPIILAGDFNTWSDSRMAIVNQLAQRLSLASLDYTNHNRTSVFGNALDHVFYRGLSPVEHDTWYVRSSDHNPTRVKFRVSDEAVYSAGLFAGTIDENNC